jgi:hypothetical protein
MINFPLLLSEIVTNSVAENNTASVQVPIGKSGSKRKR